MVSVKMCRHYTGIVGRFGEPKLDEGRACKVGVPYRDVMRVPGGGVPCLARYADEIDCPLRDFPTQAEEDTAMRRAAQRLEEHFAMIEGGHCPHCGRRMTPKRVGRCQYAEPCGHRLNEIPAVQAPPAAD